MSYGLQVRGSHGDLAIDETYRNIMFIKQGSASGARVDIPIPSQAPFAPQVYVRPWADGHYVGAFSVLNNTTVRLWTNKVVNSANQGNIGFDYVIFGINGVAPIDGSSYGLKVWDANGNVSFDSRYEQARIQHVMLISQPGQTVNGSTTIYPQTFNYPTWGLRPWINVNPFGGVNVGDTESGYFVTTSGLDKIVVRQADFYTGGEQFGISWVDNSFAGVVAPFPGNAADVALMRRYTD